MRISDWSSDVCSSDLFLEAFLKQVTTDRTRPTSVLFRTDDDGVIRTWPDRPPNLPPLMANALAPVDAAHADFQGNIRFLVPARAHRGQESGRGACRE